MRNKLVIGAIGAILCVLAVFGIALGVTEWRMPDDNADLIADLEAKIGDLEGEMSDLTKADTDLKSRISELETPLLPADRDIQELYAMAFYSGCVWDANMVIEGHEAERDSVYMDYLADNATYSEYSAAFDAYSRAYDAYDAELDSCWDTFVEESPFN